MYQPNVGYIQNVLSTPFSEDFENNKEANRLDKSPFHPPFSKGETSV
jgi:hypothetical protein